MYDEALQEKYAHVESILYEDKRGHHSVFLPLLNIQQVHVRLVQHHIWFTAIPIKGATS